MSFSDECKIELWEEAAPRKPCCRRALAQGLLFCADTTGGVFRMTVPDGELARHATEFLAKQLHTQIECEPFRRAGRAYVALTLLSKGMLSQLQRAGISDLPLSRLLSFDCEHCLRYFLRGVFIAAASVSNPQKMYHMEFSCRDMTTARRLADVLEEVAAPPKMIRRSNGVHLYYKSSVAIEDILSYLHTRRALFTLINSKIEHDIRNDENRATNCVAKNIQKAVDAASAQTEAIRYLRESGAWDKLPPHLRVTAELRLIYEDATLAELASRHNPPITKSGLNHRLQKLAALAREQHQPS